MARSSGFPVLIALFDKKEIKVERVFFKEHFKEQMLFRKID